MSEPKISVVTVCYNVADTIEATMLSVLNQTYSNVEYIVIDGGSTDGTVDIIRKYEDKIAYWVSEPDKGIYDAMNKGIKAATGEWINFMNAGDKFFNDKVIYNIFNDTIYDDKVKAIYGDVLLVTSKYQKTMKGRVNPSIYRMPSCHQAIFTAIDVMSIGFDTKYKICADYNFYFQLYNICGRDGYVYKPMTIAIYENECGLSVVQDEKHRKERIQIGKSHKDFNWWVEVAKWFVKFKILSNIYK